MGDIERFYEAVRMLNGLSKVDCEEAGKYLNSFQSTVEAWGVADEVLTEAKNPVACIFAAQTMRKKMIKDFRQLPETAHQSLRDSIVNHLAGLEAKLGNSYQPVATQLCVALADLYLQVPSWNNFIAQLLNQFAERAQNDIKAAHILLELFKVFPEELQNSNLKIGENRRKAVQDELANQTEAVIYCLELICKAAPADLQTKAITTLGSWLSNKQCPGEAINKSFFFHSILEALANPECPHDVHFAAASTVTQAMTFCEDLERNQGLAHSIMEKIFKTETAFDVAYKEEDMDKLSSYGRLYSELCTMLLEPIVNTPNEGFGNLKSLDLVNKVTEYNDYTIVQSVFDVWYRLSEALYYLNDQEFREKRDFFRPYVEKFIKNLTKTCRFEYDTDRIPPDTDDFIDFRYQAQDSVKDVVFILGTLDLIESVLDDVLNSIARQAKWTEMEAGLFIIKSAASSIVKGDELVTPRIVNLLLQVPLEANPIVLKTTLELIGELNEWLGDRHMEIVQCVQWMLSLQEHSIKQLLKTWAGSLQLVTSCGNNHLFEFFDKIYTALEHVQTWDGPIREIDDAAQEITKAATNLLNDRPSSEIAQGLATLLTQPLLHLSNICAHPHLRVTEKRVHTKEDLLLDPLAWLDRITCVYRVLKPWTEQDDFKSRRLNQQEEQIPVAWYEHSVGVARQLSTVFNTFKDDVRVMEHCCRSVRFVVRSMGWQSINFIPDLAQQLVAIYNEYPHSCILYLSSVIVDENGANENLHDGLINLLKYLAPKAFLVLNSGDGPRQHPETIDDLYRLAVRYCHRLPAALFREEVTEQLVQGATYLIETEHQDANKSVLLFLTEVMNLASSQKVPPPFQPTVDTARSLILKYGDKIIWHCIHGAIFHLSAHIQYEVAALIKLLLQVCHQQVDHWVDMTIVNLPKDSGLSATSAQLQAFKGKLMASTRTTEISNELRELSRLYT
ncbi:unnamed protein product [Bursaphelenchus xylophilus]|uniref:(pine wood nematode) hypothetical protein n=1 Tax=Bursaphelenchus xylophilus TaxID=6326 RepID=A0A1I7RPY5_BURXY|nr:unnamed protein product [Bursaphelenchus xylophilus]CAG9096830.1 unnamed protein product [Bursaphelenchus xylophilus]